jgi:hypothetical protein
MSRWLPPLLLVTALATFIAGFALVASGLPEAGIRLHQARASGDEQYRELLEAQLQRRRRRREVLIGALFASTVLLTASAFLSMSSPGRSRRRKSRKAK